MDRLLLDLDSKEYKNFEFPENKNTIMVFFATKDQILLKDLNKDLVDRDYFIIGVYIGDENAKVSQFSKKELKTMKVLTGGSSLNDWKQYGANETPWILIVKNNEVLLSNKPSAIGRPYMRNIKKKISTTPSASLSPSGRITPAVDQKNLQIERIDEMERISRQNQEEIKLLKENLAEKSKILADILERL